MRKQYLSSRKWEKTYVVIIHIYGSRDFFLIFCDNQDTEYDSQRNDFGIAGTILTHRITPKDLWDNGVHTLQDE